ncbi:MAG: hypothetical protein ACODAU_08400 [Myxococcota bacterium]
MIDPDLRFEGFDSRTWSHLLSLFAPAAGDSARESSPRGTLLVVVDHEGDPLAALHVGRGRLDDVPVPVDPAALCATYGARRCIVLRDGALDELAERVALRLEPDDDYLAQGLATLHAVRELQAAGLLHTWPSRHANVPIPTVATVHRALDLVLPEGRVAVIALWRGTHLWTATALRRGAGGIDQVLGSDPIGHWCGGTLEGGFRQRAADVLAAVHEHLGPVHVGVFAEAHSVKRLLRQAEPGAWAAAVAGKEILVQPMPPYVAMALGADVLRAITRSSSRLLGERFDPTATLLPFATAVRQQLERARSLTQLLGFDPLELLSRYLDPDR